MDPSNIAGKRDIIVPILLTERCQYVHEAAWMSHSIPHFAEKSALLYYFLEESYRKARKETKRVHLQK